MRLFRKPTSIAHDIAFFAVLAQFWLAFACCIPQDSDNFSLTDDTWCSIAPLDKHTASDTDSHTGHACDCVVGCAVAAHPAGTSVLSVVAFSVSQAPFTILSVLNASKGTSVGAVGSRAPPFFLQPKDI
ncbi:DUF2946 family protein [Kordiimonas pumila]|uniref:DUF2946 family protein n=1 Tax=Kordiimonas pumila TaxID=2161677 RepID=A0ABV7D1V8_9PROT|nr:DUF2946 family protein [Kordiimonas pumila]